MVEIKMACKNFAFLLLMVTGGCVNSDNDAQVKLVDRIDTPINRYGSHVFRNGHLNTPKISFPNTESELTYDRHYDKKRKVRKIVNEYDRWRKGARRWPNNTVPYEISSDMSREMIERIHKAINHWHWNTCIRFVVYDAIKHANYKSRLFFQPMNGTICGSSVGYTEDLPMTINTVYLADCSFGSIVHELGHTVGFYHEHSRTDRDNHVFIDFSRIGDDMTDQYSKMSDQQAGYYGVPYDLYSIMHYPSQNVIRSLDPRRQFLMGQRLALSYLDIKLANLAYKCSRNCPPTACQHEGFLDEHCKCVCPDGFGGTLCEVFIMFGKNNLNTAIDEETMNFNCDFQNRTLCAWTQDQYRATDDWIFNKAELGCLTETQQFFSSRDKTFKTGPQVGDPSTTDPCVYIYLNSLRKSAANANAILATPAISFKSDFVGCLEFHYQMYKGEVSNKNYPIQIGNLSVIVQNSIGNRIVVWTVNGTQGMDWKVVSINVPLKAPTSILSIEAQLIGWSYGDIAIDNIRLSKQPCRRQPMLNVLNVKISPSKWSDWSSCSATCGQGVRIRTRTCSHFDADCKSQEVIGCQMPACPIYWSEWNEWSECSAVACGTGYHYRVRVCKNPDWRQCIGSSIEYKDCIKSNCTDKNSSWKNETKRHLPSTPNALPVYDDVNTKCGGVYTLSQLPNGKAIIQSPNYPQPYDANTRCNYLIKSPENTKITIRLIDVDLEASSKDTCIDSLELRYYNLAQPGPLYCGYSALSGQTKITGYSNFFLLIFRSNWPQTTSRRGFSFEATYQ